MITALNQARWYTGRVSFTVDRLDLLGIVGSLELTLRHPDLGEAARAQMIKLGKAFASTLINEGVIIPDEARESWERTFKMKCKLQPVEDLNAVYCDVNGRPFK